MSARPKKKLGRPSGRKKPQRPVIGARVPEDFYAVIVQAAKSSGRTISEELVWRVRQTFAEQPATSVPTPAGCICPPTSEQTCMNIICPRRPLTGA
jgi:hypothetical protein